MNGWTSGAVWVLAPAWGALLAAPLVLAARRSSTRARTHDLNPPPFFSAGSCRSGRLRPAEKFGRWVPGPMRSIIGSVRDRSARRRETAELERELPLAVDLLQVAVSAGATPYRAVELTTRWGPPAVGAHLSAALDATHLGGSLGDALERTATVAPALAPITTVVATSDRLGAPAGPALTRLARELRTELRRRAEARARTLPVKLLFPLVFLVLPAFGLLTVVPALLQALARA
jgi:hypothetical protein